MDRKVGRPKVENTKDYKVTARLDESERKILEYYCRKYLLTESKAIRKIIQLAKME